MLRRLVPVAVLGLLVSACANTLPDQDRRITEAHPAEKISVDFLWKEYQADAKAADRKYWGKAIDVTGKVTSAESSAPQRVMFLLQSEHGIEARLLDDQAAAIIQSAVVGERTTLRCFCAGLSGNVILKSCIKP